MSSLNSYILSSNVLSSKKLTSLTLNKVKAELSEYRNQYLELLENAEKISQFNFDRYNTDPRAVRRNGIAKAYYTLIERLTREPTLSEVTKLYNARYRSQISKWTIRRTILKMNEQLSDLDLKITLTKETPSLVYTRDVASAYFQHISKGQLPSSEDLIKLLKLNHPERSVTHSVIKLHLSILRKNGVSVPLRQGDLTREIVEDSFVKLTNRLRSAPSIEQMQRYIKDTYQIVSSRKAISKMLQLVRESKPKSERIYWYASRTKAIYDPELVKSYNSTKKDLAERCIKRLPAISDIQKYIKHFLGKTPPSHDTLVLRYQRINEGRQNKHQAPLRFTKRAFQHHDIIEESAYKLLIKLERPATLKEIRKEANKTARPKLTLSQVDKAVRTINKHRKPEDKVSFTYEISSQVYSLDVLRVHRTLTRIGGMPPTRGTLLNALLAENKNRALTMSGLNYRIQALRREGYEIKFRQSPKNPVKSWAERMADREKRINDERAALCNKIVREELSRSFRDGVPSHIKKQTQFFYLCVEVALNETRNAEAKARRELRDLLRIHRKPMRQHSGSELDDEQAI